MKPADRKGSKTVDDFLHFAVENEAEFDHLTSQKNFRPTVTGGTDGVGRVGVKSVTVPRSRPYVSVFL